MELVVGTPVVDTFVAEGIGKRDKTLSSDALAYRVATEESFDEDREIDEILNRAAANGVNIRRE